MIERGGAPEVFKFDGTAYVADTGDIDLAPEALSPWDAAADAQGLADRSDVLWFSIEDDMPEEAESVFLWFYVNRVLEGEGAMRALPGDFRIGVAELDGAAPAEVIVRAASRAYCSPAGCRFWVYRPQGDDAPRSIATFDGIDLRIAASGAAGHRDLIVTGRGGLEVWRHDGSGYARQLPDQGAATSALDPRP